MRPTQADVNGILQAGLPMNGNRCDSARAMPVGGGASKIRAPPEFEPAAFRTPLIAEAAVEAYWEAGLVNFESSTGTLDLRSVNFIVKLIFGFVWRIVVGTLSPSTSL